MTDTTTKLGVNVTATIWPLHSIVIAATQRDEHHSLRFNIAEARDLHTHLGLAIEAFDKERQAAISRGIADRCHDALAKMADGDAPKAPPVPATHSDTPTPTPAPVDAPDPATLPADAVAPPLELAPPRRGRGPDRKPRRTKAQMAAARAAEAEAAKAIADGSPLPHGWPKRVCFILNKMNPHMAPHAFMCNPLGSVPGFTWYDSTGHEVPSSSLGAAQKIAEAETAQSVTDCHQLPAEHMILPNGMTVECGKGSPFHDYRPGGKTSLVASEVFATNSAQPVTKPDQLTPQPVAKPASALSHLEATARSTDPAEAEAGGIAARKMGLSEMASPFTDGSEPDRRWVKAWRSEDRRMREAEAGGPSDA